MQLQKPFEISKEIDDGHTIANMELVQNKIPFIIRRPMPNAEVNIGKLMILKI